MSDERERPLTPEERAERIADQYYAELGGDVRANSLAASLKGHFTEAEAAARRAALEEAARAVCIWCAVGIERRGSRHVTRLTARPDCAAWGIWRLLEEPSDE